MFTLLGKWIKRGQGSHYVVKRLKEAGKILTRDNLAKIKKVALKFKGKPYDIYFEWSDQRIYCSELAWKIYKCTLGIELGKLEKLKDFDLGNKLVREKIKERFGDKIPYEEFVISPAQMFHSDKLITVQKK
jgi:hypothetical protein